MYSPVLDFLEGRLDERELHSRVESICAHGTAQEQNSLVQSVAYHGRSLSPGTLSRINETIGRTKSAPGQGADPEETFIERAPPPRRVLKVGDVVNRRFVLEERIGEGGMGMVYRALDLRRQETQDRFPYVALKVIKDELSDRPDAIRALQREVRKNQRLRHRNVASVYDYDRDGDLSYITMELLSGETLDGRMARVRPGTIPLPEARHILSQVASALDAAHAIDLIHLDLKPANIFVESNDEVKLIDFGISKVLQKPGVENATLFDVGKLGALTPAYASVEMLLGEEVDARDDVYSFSVIAYEAITGRHPFNRKTALVASAQHLKPAKPEALTERQWQALLRGLDFDKARRTVTASQVADGLREEIKAPAGAAIRRAGSGRWYMLAGALASGAVFAAVLGTMMLWHAPVPSDGPKASVPPVAPPQPVPISPSAPSGPLPSNPRDAVRSGAAGDVAGPDAPPPAPVVAPPPEPPPAQPALAVPPASPPGSPEDAPPQSQPAAANPKPPPAAHPAPRAPASLRKGTPPSRPHQRDEAQGALGPTLKRIQKEVEGREPGAGQPDKDAADLDSPDSPAPSSRPRTRAPGNAVRGEPGAEAAPPGPAQPKDASRTAPAAPAESAGQPGAGDAAPSPPPPAPVAPKPTAQPRVDFYYPGRKAQQPSQ